MRSTDIIRITRNSNSVLLKNTVSVVRYNPQALDLKLTSGIPIYNLTLIFSISDLGSTIVNLRS